MNFKTVILYLVFFLFINTSLQANTTDNWTNYYSDNDVLIEYQNLNCEYSDRYNQEFVILKITNLTNNQISVSWNNESWYDKKCINCSVDDTNESYNQVLIDANKFVTGNCSTQNNLRIFSKFSDSLANMPGVKKIVKLTKFKLKNINIRYE